MDLSLSNGLTYGVYWIMCIIYMHTHTLQKQANQINQHTKRVIHCDQVALIPGTKISLIYKNQSICIPCNKIKDKHYIIISMDKEKKNIWKF